MIQHLAHAELDKDAWDAMLLKAPNRSWYARSAVLDAAAPGWDALVDEDRRCLMPLAHRTRFGIPYLFQPIALQQGGVFGDTERHPGIVRAFLEAIPRKFRFVDITMYTAACAQLPAGAGEARTNHHLSLAPGMEVLRTGYGSQFRRNVAKAVQGTLRKDVAPEAFVALFARTTARRFKGSGPRELGILHRLLVDAAARGELRIHGVEEQDGLHAAAAFILWEGRAILLKSANDERGRGMRAMFRLLDSFIQEHAGSGLVLDFAGSNDPGTARFYAGCGAGTGIYLRLIRNRLPPPLCWLKPRSTPW
jgi:hypothetical protein